MLNRKKLLCYKYLLIALLIFLNSCWDTTPPDNFGGTPKFVTSTEDRISRSFGKGMIHAAGETLGVFMDNIAKSDTIACATDLAYENAYMGLIQEDVFRYSRDKFLSQYLADPDTAGKKYLKIASQVKAVMTCYKRYVFFLVNTDNLGSGVALTDILANSTALKINLGSIDSQTYISAKTITDSHTFTAAPAFSTDAAAVGIQKVVSGEYDAAFLVDDHLSSTLSAIAEDAPVKLIQVYMPEGKKYYQEDGTIYSDDYAFQEKAESTIVDNITVRTLLAVGPLFSDRVLGIFIDYVLDNIGDYSAHTEKWNAVSRIDSKEYIISNPQNCSYRAVCHILGYDELDLFYVDNYFCSGEETSVDHDMATELIWLLSYNLDIDLKEMNTTGSWENSYWIDAGSAKMGIVQDDVYSDLASSETVADTIQIASMKKVAPLNYVYLHCVVNTDAANWGALGGVPATLEGALTGATSANTPIYINAGPKTSGTFYAAMQLIKSYSEETNFENLEIHYSFGEPSDSVAKVASGDYNIAFVVSGLPYYRFYSHDTYSIPANTRIISTGFCDNEIPYPYEEGTILGNGSAVYEDYPYPSGILPDNDITTIRLRSNLVMSSVFDDTYISKYIISIFRKTYYMINPYDPDEISEGYAPDPLWISILMNSYDADDTYFESNYGSYGEDIVGAKEYFARNPFGWSAEAAEYYLSTFSD
ncbi:MAG: hypothetical protein JW864_17195 [Spirochaetes bacterium]|nr:hypothetical protein [Spirochaetota bacterium]